MKKSMALSFYSYNRDVLDVLIENIKLKVYNKDVLGKGEVLIFISDDSGDFYRTILFKIF